MENSELAHPCPPWCNGVHELEDDLHISHRSDAEWVPVIEREFEQDNRFVAPSASQLVIGLERRGEENWVWIAPAEDAVRSLVLTVESARRFHRILTGVLRQTESDTRPVRPMNPNRRD